MTTPRIESKRQPRSGDEAALHVAIREWLDSRRNDGQHDEADLALDNALVVLGIVEEYETIESITWYTMPRCRSIHVSLGSGDHLVFFDVDDRVPNVVITL